jgi:5-methylcytosine-specific restriction protein A
MPRLEFSRKQRLEIWHRANGHCEGDGCGAKLKLGEGEYDHRIAQGYGGENTVENGQLLCRVCHGKKTGIDKGITEKVKRVRDKHLGIYPASRAKLQGRGFSKSRLWPASTDPSVREVSD